MATSSIPPALSSIEQLPDEILLQILRNSRADATLPDFLVVLRVSKRFHQIGRPAAFELLKLNNANFDKWYESTKYIGTQYSAVKCLTVHLRPVYPNICKCECAYWDHSDARGGDYQECGNHCLNFHDWASVHYGRSRHCASLHDRLKALEVALKSHLRQIVSFSLVVDVEPETGLWCVCYRPDVTDFIVVDIINALAPMCMSLMLDLKCCSQHARSWDQNWPCLLCDVLRRKMTTLEDMWVRATGLCTWFFVPDHQKLSEAYKLQSPFELWFEKAIPNDRWIISDSRCYDFEDRAGYWSMWQMACQDKRQYYTELSQSATAAIVQPSDCPNFSNLKSLTINYATFPTDFDMDDTTKIAKIAAALQIAITEWSLFPRLKACQLVAQHQETLASEEFEAIGREDPSLAPFSELFMLDVVENTTTILPFRSILPENKFKLYCISEQPNFYFHDLSTAELEISSFQDLDDMIKAYGSHGWISTRLERASLPWSYASRMENLSFSERSDSPLADSVAEASSKDDNLFWLHRALSSVVQKHNSLLDHYGARDPSTGKLETHGDLEA